MKASDVDSVRKASWLAAAAVTVVLTVAMIYLRIRVYPHRIVPLADALPLLIAFWHRDRVLLWGMAACFLVVAAVKAIWGVPDQFFDGSLQRYLFAAMLLLNIGIPAMVVHLVLNYRERLEWSNEEAAEANAELEAGNEELAASNEQLAAREEDISRQNEELQSQTEELQQQAEELEQQTEELRTQSEEIQALNEELLGREKTLQLLLQLSGPATSEPELLHQICRAAPELLREDVLAVAILEHSDGQMVVRSHSAFGADTPETALPAESTLAAMALEQQQVAELEDTRLRPDLVFPPMSSGEMPRSLISVPLSLTAGPGGALEAYASQPRSWSQQQIQLLEWLAGQCTRVWESVRLRDELARQQAQLRTLADAIPQLAWIAEPDGHISWYNRRWYEYTGTTPEQMEGWGWQSVHDPNVLPEVLQRWKASITTGEPFDMTFPLRGADGGFRPFLTRVMPLTDEHGQVLRWFGTNTDISEQKRGEEALKAAKEAAEAANVAKGQFLANMSHELRTPMNAILGMIDVALPKATDPTVQDCLQTAKGSADLLLALLNDLLDTAKIESGKMELESAPFSLRRMLDQLTRVLAVRASEKGLAFCCRVPEDTPDALVGDRMRLQQVLLNLAGNAIKFTDRGEVEIRVRTLSRDGRGCLEFAVRDTGIGIPPARLEHIFEPFAQADASMARRFGGTGLGLSICKHLVEMMGGRVGVESDSGKGSTFYFTVSLPLATELPSDSEAPAVVPLTACTPLRILLVEDNPANQKLARYILEDRGHMVEIAGDGREAIGLTDRHCYDLILMDVQMPGMNGLDAAAAIRKREEGRSRVPIIAMTAHAMRGDRERCLAAGMDGYLSKPIHGQEMVALVEQLSRKAAGVRGETSRTAPVNAPPASVFNAEVALALCAGSHELLADMVQCFRDDFCKLLPQMREALRGANLAEVGRLAHRLKGTLVYLGAERAVNAAMALEEIAKEGGGHAEVEESIHALEHQCQVLRTALASEERQRGQPGQ